MEIVSLSTLFLSIWQHNSLRTTLIFLQNMIGIIKMLEFLIDNIYVKFSKHVFQQEVGVPVGTNCVPLLAALFLYGGFIIIGG